MLSENTKLYFLKNIILIFSIIIGLYCIDVIKHWLDILFSINN